MHFSQIPCSKDLEFIYCFPKEHYSVDQSHSLLIFLIGQGRTTWGRIYVDIVRSFSIIHVDHLKFLSYELSGYLKELSHLNISFELR